MREQIERIVREHLSHREQHAYPELVESMIEQLTALLLAGSNNNGE